MVSRRKIRATLAAVSTALLGVSLVDSGSLAQAGGRRLAATRISLWSGTGARSMVCRLCHSYSKVSSITCILSPGWVPQLNFCHADSEHYSKNGWMP